MYTMVLAWACLPTASYQTITGLAHENMQLKSNIQLPTSQNISNGASTADALQLDFLWKHVPAHRQSGLTNPLLAVAMLLHMFNPVSRQAAISSNLSRRRACRAEVSMLHKDDLDEHINKKHNVGRTSMKSEGVQSDRAPMFVCDGVEYVVKESGLEFGGGLKTGYKIWESGWLLSKILLSEYRKRLPAMRVLELGSGTGVGGLSAAAGDASVLLTDGSAGVLPLLEANVQANHLNGNVEVCNLLWGYEPDDTVRSKGPFDLIIGSDLLYAPDAFSDLLVTLSHLCIPGHTEVLLTFPLRYTEDMFFNEAAQRNFKFIEPITEVEPYLFRATLQLMDELH